MNILTLIHKTKALVYHPDKETEDEILFMNLTKAYKTLTDETAKRNWEQYGDPDGSSAISFGITLPSWIVKLGDSMLDLLVYVFIIMIVLPFIVWNWWSRSIKYSGEGLLESTKKYYYYFHKTTSMILETVIMILCASFEFHVKQNSEIQERPSGKKEIHIKLMTLAHAGQISKMPHLFSLENTMKLCPMIIQALWDHKNPLLQLPHIHGHILKYINSKYHVKTLEQFFRLDEGDKSKCLRSLTENTMRVFSTLDEWLGKENLMPVYKCMKMLLYFSYI
ncbi:hypothetical protein QYM36_013632 [Artemia franciscana]|uniref:J domain-containing protein n=1 Tax=Artemia franciscana TaxID=6661 RepID=A0AA88HIS7_ARTSF|nr:hypothetical protein QYM36_013632 [Artemia franciscana]